MPQTHDPVIRAMLGARAALDAARVNMVVSLPRVQDPQDAPVALEELKGKVESLQTEFAELRASMAHLQAAVEKVESLHRTAKKLASKISCARIVSGPVRVVMSGADCAAFLGRQPKDSTRTLVFKCTPGVTFSLIEISPNRGGSIPKATQLYSKPFIHDGVEYRVVNLLGVVDEQKLAEGEIMLRAVDLDTVSAPHVVSLAVDPDNPVTVDDLLRAAISVVGMCSPA